MNKISRFLKIFFYQLKFLPASSSLNDYLKTNLKRNPIFKINYSFQRLLVLI